MTPEQVKLVQHSFSKVVPIADQAAGMFYDRLFEKVPTVRRMFPRDMTVQKQKLMQMLATAVENLDQIEKIQPVLEQLGRNHVGYGAKPEHYDLVGETLLWTLEQGLGNAFTPAVQEAWITSYKTMARVMKTAAADMTNSRS